MRARRKWLSILGALMLVVSNVHAACSSLQLTPAHEPRLDNFYVCYESRYIKKSAPSLVAVYRKFKYLGCMISATPCHTHCIKKPNCPPLPLKPFDYFNNYFDALNAFYRCAYS